MVLNVALAILQQLDADADVLIGVQVEEANPSLVVVPRSTLRSDCAARSTKGQRCCQVAASL